MCVCACILFPQPLQVATAALQLGAESSDSYLKRKLEFEGDEKKLGSPVVTQSQIGEKVRHFVAPI
jgi:hypothetical protein